MFRDLIGVREDIWLDCILEDATTVEGKLCRYRFGRDLGHCHNISKLSFHACEYEIMSIYIRPPGTILAIDIIREDVEVTVAARCY